MKSRILSLALLAIALPLAAQQARTHTVGAGETLRSIAQQYNVSIEALTSANPRLSSSFFVGMELNIPEAVQSSKPAAVTNQPASPAYHETRHTVYSPGWTIGLSTGLHFNSVSYSDLDDKIFYDPTGTTSAIFGAFARYDFGKNLQFSLRPEILWLQRGHDISVKDKFIDQLGTKFSDLEIDYNFNASYLDVRVPFMYNFGRKNDALRPYVMVAPVFGFAAGGTAEMVYSADDYETEYYDIDLSKASVSTFEFAAALGGGARYCFNNKFELGLELSYELGLTDTYGTEADGEAIAVQGSLSRIYKIEGTRKFSGFQVRLTAGIPISGRKTEVTRTELTYDTPAPVAAPVQTGPVIHERECFELEQIVALIEQGRSVEGKTICATDAIEFKYKRSDINRNSYPYLNNIVTLLQNTTLRVDIKGHTDNIGSEEYNLDLSQKRAKAVYDYLVKHGIDKERLTYEGFGFSEPVADNDTDEGRRQNRRVEFVLKN